MKVKITRLASHILLLPLLCLLLCPLCVCATEDIAEVGGEWEEYPAEGIGYSEFGYWLGFSLVAYVAPLAIGTVGLVLPRVKKMGNSRYWYLLSAASCVWIVLGILLNLILALA